jgi:hypothetical protein
LDTGDHAPDHGRQGPDERGIMPMLLIKYASRGTATTPLLGTPILILGTRLTIGPQITTMSDRKFVEMCNGVMAA